MLVVAALKLSGSHGKKATQTCPCGYASDPVKECVCTPSAVSRCMKHISGPLLDRIERARRVQAERFKGTSLVANAEMGPVEVWDFCKLDDSATGLLQAAMKQMNLSARGFHRILKLSRTIADLAGVEGVGVGHLAEALQHRPGSWV